MAPKYKLSYFDVTALGEPIRFLFAYAGIEYENFQFTREEWPKYKPDMPFGQAPVLEIDGKKHNQSVAITRYVAKLAKLTGKDALHDLELDSMAENINDVRLKMVQYWYEKDEKFKKYLYEPLVSTHLPFMLGKLNEVAEKNNGYFVRGQLSWVDMFFASMLNYFAYMVGFDVVEKYPGLQKVRDNVFSIPVIQEWVKIRPIGRC